MENENKPLKKEIEIVNGDGKDLDISQVFDHNKESTPKKDNYNEEKKEIIIPKGSSDKNEN